YSAYTWNPPVRANTQSPTDKRQAGVGPNRQPITPNHSLLPPSTTHYPLAVSVRNLFSLCACNFGKIRLPARGSSRAMIQLLLPRKIVDAVSAPTPSPPVM